MGQANRHYNRTRAFGFWPANGLPTNKKITRITCLIRCQIDFKKIVVLQIKMVTGKPDPNILLYWTSDQTKAVRVFFHFHSQQVSLQTLHFFGGCLTSAGASANTWNHRAPNHCTFYFSPQRQTWTKTKQNWTYKCWLVPHKPLHCKLKQVTFARMQLNHLAPRCFCQTRQVAIHNALNIQFVSFPRVTNQCPTLNTGLIFNQNRSMGSKVWNRAG